MYRKTGKPLFVSAALPLTLASAFAQTAAATESSELETVYVTAERQVQQQLGASKISAQDLAGRPVVNDLSEMVRTMPGVNLTGNTATGQRGNKRQIDIRGMGPENTLILIDGKPVNSRHAERISMRGERNTRGDSNWVPPEMVERVDVLRGPAAVRYGSGAMGGVVNIVTKKAGKKLHGALTYYTNRPQDKKEGASQRIGFSLGGPIVADVLSFRLYGSLSKTEADAVDINAAAGNADAAGVEGVRNKDIAGRLHWRVNSAHTLTLDGSFSRQGNIYNGDTQNSSTHALARALRDRLASKGAETARLYRTAASLTHDGVWQWGDTKSSISYERTRNSRFPEYLAGGPEGSYSSDVYSDSTLRNLRLHSEAYIPLAGRVPQVLTVGAEFTDSRLDDAASMTQGFSDQGRADVFDGVAGSGRSGKTAQRNWAIYAEDNISLGSHTNVIPSLRFDHNSDSGSNLSPALNFAHRIGSDWTLKGGVARAYKSPNLYQTNPNFILYTRGNGCPLTARNGVRCYFVGSSALQPETSINKEFGVEFKRNGWQVSANYFHNDYRNKITIGDTLVAESNIGNPLYRWANTPKATVSGFEGNVLVPLHETLKWNTNFTYMQKSADHLGNPLSLIPKHTINSTLSWTPNHKWDANLTFTHYGTQKPRAVAINRTEAGIGRNTSPLTREQEQIAPYGIWGVNAGYRFNRHSEVRLGVSNLTNKQLYRTGKGARTYNEHGRAFYASLRVGF